MNLPNLLSLLRIILTPLFIIFLFSDNRLLALIIFAVAAITDAYDGHLARKYNQITPQGKFLDPLADKILVLSYSPYDQNKKSHPRVVTLEFLKELAKKYFKFVEIKSIGKFTHNKLNKTSLHLNVLDEAELLIVCKN